MTVVEEVIIRNGKPFKMPKSMQPRKVAPVARAEPEAPPAPPPVPPLVRYARRAAMGITAGIAAVSFVLSFSGLRGLAEAAGIPSALAWLWPLTVDGTIIQATMAIIALAAYPAQLANRRFFWAAGATGAAVSIGGNMLHAALAGPMPPLLAAAIAAVAPLSLLATTHGLAVLVRFHPEGSS